MSLSIDGYKKIRFFSINDDNVSQLENHISEFKKEMLSITNGLIELDLRKGNNNLKDTNIVKSLLEKSTSNNVFSWEIFNKLTEDILPNQKTIIFDDRIEKFEDNWFAHGQAWGRYIVLRKLYKGIVLHELAHLYGADDHYNEIKPEQTLSICTNPAQCIMQWNPGNKFCKESKKEILQFWRNTLSRNVKIYESMIKGFNEEAHTNKAIIKQKEEYIIENKDNYLKAFDLLGKLKVDIEFIEKL
jgi:hypothetical protein